MAAFRETLVSHSWKADRAAQFSARNIYSHQRQGPDRERRDADSREGLFEEINPGTLETSLGLPSVPVPLLEDKPSHPLYLAEK